MGEQEKDQLNKNDNIKYFIIMILNLLPVEFAIMYAYLRKPTIDETVQMFIQTCIFGVIILMAINYFLIKKFFSPEIMKIKQIKIIMETILSVFSIVVLFLSILKNNDITKYIIILSLFALFIPMAATVGSFKLMEIKNNKKDSKNVKIYLKTELNKFSTNEYAELRELQSLLVMGIITQEEFDLKKKDILGI